jgi:hypothetical protein
MIVDDLSPTGSREDDYNPSQSPEQPGKGAICNTQILMILM